MSEEYDEFDELNDKLDSFEMELDMDELAPRCGEAIVDVTSSHNSNSQKEYGGLSQFTSSDGISFFPASNTVDRIPSGVYDIAMSDMRGLYFEKIPVKTENLIDFPETNSKKVIEEIKTFWEQEDRFKKYNLTYKRGMMLWGPPGSGKSCCVQLIMNDVIEREGVVLRFKVPHLFNEGYKQFRKIMPKVPLVVILEDIESIISQWGESEILNILDGVTALDKVVFLATTNYPEQLGARIINRPSRFDKRFKMGHPKAESRMIYFKHILGDETIKEFEINLEQWVEDTEGMSIAHLKELFISSCILNNPYEEAVRTLQKMVERQPRSGDCDDPNFGFASAKKKIAGSKSSIGTY